MSVGVLYAEEPIKQAEGSWNREKRLGHIVCQTFFCGMSIK